jgi:hypothetical protein
MRHRQSSVTIETQYPVRSIGAPALAEAAGGGGATGACAEARLQRLRITAGAVPIQRHPCVFMLMRFMIRSIFWL